MGKRQDGPQFIRIARSLAQRWQEYVESSPAQIQNIADNYPLLSRLVKWLRKNPRPSVEEIQTAAYRIATEERNTLGILKISAIGGGSERLLREKMQRPR